MRTELKAFADANPESLNILNASAELIKLREYAEKNGKNVEAMNAYMKKKKEEATLHLDDDARGRTPRVRILLDSGIWVNTPGDFYHRNPTLVSPERRVRKELQNFVCEDHPLKICVLFRSSVENDQYRYNNLARVAGTHWKRNLAGANRTEF